MAVEQLITRSTASVVVASLFYADTPPCADSVSMLFVCAAISLVAALKAALLPLSSSEITSEDEHDF